MPLSKMSWYERVKWSGTKDEMNEVAYRPQELPERRKEKEKV